MSTDRMTGAFKSYRRPEDTKAELQLLGREVDEDLLVDVGVPKEPEQSQSLRDIGGGSSQLPATYVAPRGSGLNPRPRIAPEPTTQMSFRVPLTLARQFRKKARYNQLEQQEIIADVLRRALAELPDPPPDWNE